MVNPPDKECAVAELADLTTAVESKVKTSLKEGRIISVEQVLSIALRLKDSPQKARSLVQGSLGAISSNSDCVKVEDIQPLLHEAAAKLLG